MTSLTIVIPTKNRPDQLRRALLSFADVGDAAEVVVVDDGSCGENSRRNETHCHWISGCRYLFWASSQGASAARNLGFKMSGGAYVWFLDDDDYAPPRTVRDVLRAVTSRCDQRILLMPRTIVADDTPIKCDVPANTPDKFEHYRRVGVEVTTSCAVFPREVVARLDGWDETLPALQDADLFLRAARIAQFAYLETEPVRVDVSAPARITNGFLNSQIGKLKFLRKHWQILPTRRRLWYLMQIAACSPLWRAPRTRRQLAQARRRERASHSRAVTALSRGLRPARGERRLSASGGCEPPDSGGSPCAPLPLYAVSPTESAIQADWFPHNQPTHRGVDTPLSPIMRPPRTAATVETHTRVAAVVAETLVRMRSTGMMRDAEFVLSLTASNHVSASLVRSAAAAVSTPARRVGALGRLGESGLRPPHCR